jgi:hypothetical protein
VAYVHAIGDLNLSHANRIPWLGSQGPVCAPRPGWPPAAVPAGGVAPGGAPADPKRMPISGDQMPGVGTDGGATAALMGWGAVRGVAVSDGRWA